ERLRIDPEESCGAEMSHYLRCSVAGLFTNVALRQPSTREGKEAAVATVLSSVAERRRSTLRRHYGQGTRLRSASCSRSCRRLAETEATKNPELLLDDATEASVGDNAGEKEAAYMEIFMLHSACEREELLSVRHVERPLVISLTRTIASIDKCDAYHKYRVLKADMPRLRRPLGFPEWVTLANGSVFTGEEA
ncbi:unnamed protein product, partial [Pylaiella littoralis]